MNSILSAYKTKAFKKGSVFTIITIGAIILTILINVAVGMIPAVYTRIDTTREKLFTLSEQTKSILGSLEHEVTIYQLSSGGMGDENISELLKRYASLSDKITVTMTDTALYPEFSKQYTDISLADNSVIVVSGERTIAVNYYDIYTASSDEYAYYGYYDIFDGESQLTSAIDYVTSENLPKLYTLQGHGEGTLSTELKQSIEKQNIEVSALDLSGTEAIPEDAGCLFIYSPTRDISDAEYDMIVKYMETGGRLLITVDYLTDRLPVFDKLIGYYGLQYVDGVVFEGEGGKYVPKYPYYIYPVTAAHEIMNPIIDAKLNILFPVASGIKVDESPRETLYIEQFLTTSDTAFSKVDISSKLFTKEENDIAGPFALGVSVSETVGENEARFVMFSTSQFIDSNINKTVGGANYDLFLNSLGYLCDKPQSVSVHAKNMYSASVAVPSGACWLMFIILIIFVPAVFVGIAVTVTHIRKSR